MLIHLLLYLFTVACPITLLELPDQFRSLPPPIPSKSNDYLADFTLLLCIFEWCPHKVKDLMETMGITENENKYFLLQLIIFVQGVKGMLTSVLTISFYLCVPQCNSDYVPVCGSNGESYQNECYLRQAACKQQSEILVASEGSCATGMYVILKIPKICGNHPCFSWYVISK